MNITDNKRMLALDAMRGITVAGMIMVNNPGSWEHIFSPLRHAEWNGLTPTDLVFPFFMFIMGISTAMSLKRFSFRLSGRLTRKILKRTVIIFLIGLLLDRIAAFCWGLQGSSWLSNGLHAVSDLSDIRILGVLQRLAICYGISAFLGAVMSRRAISVIVVVILTVYGIALLIFNGFEFSEINIIGIVDRAILGTSHMYHDSVGGVYLAFDPEGLLSTIPSIAHTLIGFLAGRMIIATPDKGRCMLNLFIAGTILIFAGLLLNYGLPMNKKIWSPTFVLTTCGMASSLLALLIWIIDVKEYRRWTVPFNTFGTNPLFLYVLSGVLAVLVGTIFGDQPYRCLLAFCPMPELASFIYAIVFVSFNWVIGYMLYRRNIIIKI